MDVVFSAAVQAGMVSVPEDARPTCSLLFVQVYVAPSTSGKVISATASPEQSTSLFRPSSGATPGSTVTTTSTGVLGQLGSTTSTVYVTTPLVVPALDQVS